MLVLKFVDIVTKVLFPLILIPSGIINGGYSTYEENMNRSTLNKKENESITNKMIIGISFLVIFAMIMYVIINVRSVWIRLALTGMIYPQNIANLFFQADLVSNAMKNDHVNELSKNEKVAINSFAWAVWWFIIVGVVDLILTKVDGIEILWLRDSLFVSCYCLLMYICIFISMIMVIGLIKKITQNASKNAIFQRVKGGVETAIEALISNIGNQ